MDPQDENTGTDNANDQNDNGASDNGTGEWTPPTKEEWEKFQTDQKATAEALKKANAESAQRRKDLANLKAQHETDAEKQQREATEAASKALKPVAIRAEARSAFLAAGANPDKAAKLIRLLDMSAIDIDGESVTGLDDQVAELKTEFPELFSSNGSSADDNNGRPRPPKLDTTGRRAPSPNQPKSVGEIIAAQVGRK